MRMYVQRVAQRNRSSYASARRDARSMSVRESETRCGPRRKPNATVPGPLRHHALMSDRSPLPTGGGRVDRRWMRPARHHGSDQPVTRLLRAYFASRGILKCFMEVAQARLSCAKSACACIRVNAGARCVPLPECTRSFIDRSIQQKPCRVDPVCAQRAYRIEKRSRASRTNDLLVSPSRNRVTSACRNGAFPGRFRADRRAGRCCHRASG